MTSTGPPTPAASSRPTARAGAGGAATLDVLVRHGVVAVIRLADGASLLPVAEALAAGGVRALEVTLTTPGAVEALGALARTRSLDARCILGAGSVLAAEDVPRLVAAGARFVVSPVLDARVLEACRVLDVPAIPGAFTPTEIVRARVAGADVVKLFPASVLGPAFIKDLLAPLPGARLMPTGGITLETTAAWIRAGAVAVGVGSALVDASLVAGGRWAELTERARRFVECVAEARQ